MYIGTPPNLCQPVGVKYPAAWSNIYASVTHRPLVLSVLRGASLSIVSLRHSTDSAVEMLKSISSLAASQAEERIDNCGPDDDPSVGEDMFKTRSRIHA